MSPSPLAEALWRARGTGTLIAADAGGKPGTVEAAYALQAEVAALEGPRIGWKIGATSAAVQERLGFDVPFYAPLFAPFVAGNGAALSIVLVHGVGMESEFAVTMGRDLAPRAAPYSRDEVAEAVVELAPAIEVVGCRVPGWPADPEPLMIIADDGCNLAFVAGARAADWRSLDLPAHAVRVTIGGEERASGTGADVMGHPLEALAWLANQLSAAGETLRAGEVVTTGTATGFTPVAPGDTVVADFGSLGRVEVSFTA
jgi:2-keto-4-pentenoate hydratase